jgi:hypothetical protein
VHDVIACLTKAGESLPDGALFEDLKIKSLFAFESTSCTHSNDKALAEKQHKFEFSPDDFPM